MLLLSKLKIIQTFRNQEGMTDMNRVVDTEPNSKNNVDTRNDINCDVPEVEKSNNISQSEDYNQDDHDTDLNVAEKKESNNKNTNHSKSNISPKLIADNLISFPSSVNFAMAKSVRRFC